MAETGEDLARRAKAGDGHAFRLLLQRNYDLIYRVAWRFLGSAADAEDVAQEVCAQLAVKIASYDGRSRFSTWLYAVTLNAARDQARRQRQVQALQGTYASLSEHRAADWADSDARLRWLYLALDRLDGGLKETALLILAEDMSHAEAAAVLGIKENTVSWRMHEVRKRLKAMANHD